MLWCKDNIACCNKFFAPLAVLAIAVAFRVWFYSNDNWMPSRDTLRYVERVVQWKTTGQLYDAQTESARAQEYYPPLLLALMKSLSAGDKNCLRAGVIINIVAGVVFCLLSYWIGWLLFKRVSGAYIAGLFAAVNPFLIGLSIQVQREMLLLVFAAAILCLWLKDDFECPRDVVVGGVLTALAFLSRYEAVELLPMWWVVIWIRMRKNTSWPVRCGWCLVLLAVFVCSVLLLGWLCGAPPRLYYNQSQRIVRGLLR